MSDPVMQPEGGCDRAVRSRHSHSTTGPVFSAVFSADLSALARCIVCRRVPRADPPVTTADAPFEAPYEEAPPMDFSWMCMPRLPFISKPSRNPPFFKVNHLIPWYVTLHAGIPAGQARALWGDVTVHQRPPQSVADAKGCRLLAVVCPLPI